MILIPTLSPKEQERIKVKPTNNSSPIESPPPVKRKRKDIEQIKQNQISPLRNSVPINNGRKSRRLAGKSPEIIELPNQPSKKTRRSKPKSVTRTKRRSTRIADRQAKRNKKSGGTKRKRTGTNSSSRRKKKVSIVNNELNDKIPFNEFMLRQSVFVDLLSLSYSMSEKDINNVREELGLKFTGLGSRRVTALFGGGNNTNNMQYTPERKSIKETPNSLSRSISASKRPTISLITSPSISPTLSPSISPALSPSISPALSPSVSPTLSPSISPSPSLSPYIPQPVNSYTPTNPMITRSTMKRKPSRARSAPMRITRRRRIAQPLAFNNYKEDAFNFGFGQFILLIKAYEEVNKNYNKSNLNAGKNIAKQLEIAFNCSDEFDKAVA